MSKEVKREDKLFLAEKYKDWHRTLGDDLFAMDLDQIEVRYRNGSPVPVAFIELTSADDLSRCENGSKLMLDIFDRLSPGKMQGAVLLWMAKCLGIPAYIVVFQEDLQAFAVRRLGRKDRWHFGTADQYADWLRKL